MGMPMLSQSSGERPKSIGVANLHVDLHALAAGREVDPANDVWMHERAQSDSVGKLRLVERLVPIREHLTRGDERIDTPIGGHAEHVRLEDTNALLELDGPRLSIDEAAEIEAT